MHHNTHLAGIDLTTVGKQTGTLGAHDQRIVSHIHLTVGEGVQTFADGICAIAALLGLDDTVVHFQTGTGLRAVGGECTPVFALDMTAVVNNMGLVHQIGGADTAGQTQHPRHLGHTMDIVGLVAVSGKQFGVVDHQFCVFSAHHSGTNGTNRMDFRPVHGNLCIAHGGDTHTLAGEVTAAVADELHLHILNECFAVTHHDTTEVVTVGNYLQILHISVFDFAIGIDCSGNGLIFSKLAVFKGYCVGHAVMIHGAVGLVIHDNTVNDRKLHIAGIGAGIQILLNTVHGKDHPLIFRCGNLCAFPNDQLVQAFGSGNDDFLTGSNDFFIHTDSLLVVYTGA